ncbi:MAG: hypothetical protein Q7U47_10860 [Paludibacter sp.]|nr:hypothetical protein [Paludibacter sp.]
MKNIETKKFKEQKIRNSQFKLVFNALFDGKYKILTSSTVFRYDLIQKHINLDDYIKFDFPIQDWVTWIQIAKYTKFYHLKLSTVTYRISTDSMTRPSFNEKLLAKFEKEKFMYRYICERFKEDVIYDETRWNDFVHRALMAFSYKNNDFQQANFYARKIQIKTLRAICARNKNLFKIYQFIRKNFS